MLAKPTVSLLALRPTTPSWKEIITRITEDKNLDDDLKSAGLHAVEVFRKVLGERFFNDNNYEHPLQNKWGNIVAWQIAQLSEWADVLEHLQGTPEEGIYLAELLRPREKCREEGIQFLKIAASLLRAGLAIEFIRATSDGKSPDIKVTALPSGEVFYIEVTHLKKNELFERDETNFRIISNACLTYAPFLLTSVQLLRSLNEEETKEAVSMIAVAARNVYEQNSLQASRNEFIDIAFAPESDVAAFEEWLQTENRRKGIRGVEVNPDETKRITQRGRIARKVKQIPVDATGIIYMKVEYLYFFNMPIDAVVLAIKEAMTDHSQLKGIVLCTEVFDPRDNEIKEWEGREDLFSIHCVNGNVALSLYCVNEYYAGTVSSSTLDQFRRSLIPPGIE